MSFRVETAYAEGHRGYGDVKGSASPTTNPEGDFAEAERRVRAREPERKSSFQGEPEDASGVQKLS